MALRVLACAAALSGSAIAGKSSHIWSWPWESSKNEDSSKGGDFMDRYIAAFRKPKPDTGVDDDAATKVNMKTQSGDASDGVASSSSVSSSATVVDVRLSSELQQALLQGRGMRTDAFGETETQMRSLSRR
eukprot:gnl/MRDRNA2_/MRDRNA2_103524_c0_seq1.p1 gnl/MRDRNA2_/MRDRNA2_103524_c0~~gnl/MRDRNA2_/MRDRNA2_103524_c0_seq1.p1  ORF type:complete len:131 (+),score=32.45 gnl/MRDRNA2_/MRDRNA2_103524_c0_seq1:140-532(+)